MNIILTNDDGYLAEGINTLFETLSTKHNVFLFAPHEQKSACSNAITIRSQTQVDKIAENRFAVYGFPADCVNIALHWHKVPEIDLVISGINHGPNLGDDIHYSGTVGGARSGYIFGKKAIAVSINSLSNDTYFQDCSDFIFNYIDNNPFEEENEPYLLNINYPDLPPEKVIGSKVCKLGRRYYKDEYSVISENNDSVVFSMQGTILSQDLEYTDTKEINNGYITITPLTIDSTDFELFTKHVV